MPQADGPNSCTFNVVDLKPYFEDDKLENLRENSFLEGEDDVPMEDQQGEPKDTPNTKDFKARNQVMEEFPNGLYSGLNPKNIQLCWSIS